MDEALATFLGFHTLVFGLGCYILTLLTRRVFELAFPHLKKRAEAMDPLPMYWSKLSLIWNELVLDFLPMVWGGVVASLATMYPFPANISSLSGRFFFGIVVGFFSSFVYKIVKKIIFTKIGASSEADLPSSSPPPRVGS